MSQTARWSKKLTGENITVQPAEELAGVPLTEDQKESEREIKKLIYPQGAESRVAWA